MECYDDFYYIDLEIKVIFGKVVLRPINIYTHLYGKETP